MEERPNPRFVANLEPGDHLCCIYSSEREHRRVLTPFLSQGLERGEKMLYIVDAHTAETIQGYLQSVDVDVEATLATGQLVMLTSDEAYVRGGTFDPEAMIALLRQEMEQALDQGYAALRVAGEMTWALRELPGAERLIEYEAKLNQCLPHSACLAICQYDRRRFEPDVLLDVLRTHPLAVIGTEIFHNFYYVPPEEILEQEVDEEKLARWIQNLIGWKRARGALREAERRYRRFFQTSKDCAFITSLDGKWIDMNEAAVELFGYESKEELAAVRIADLYADPAEREEHIRAIQQRGFTKEYPVDLRRKDGSVINARITSVVVHDRAGDVIGFQGTIRDVTARKQAKEELREHREDLERLVEARTAELNERIAEVERLNRAMTNLLEDFQAANQNLEATRKELEAANEELESFAYSVSHDLRAPLRAISGFSRILMEDYLPDIPPEARRYLNKVNDNTKEMGQLIDDLLAFSRLSRRPIDKQEVDPNALMEDVLEELTYLQEDRQIEIAVDELPPCQADRSLLRQVWSNLLSNALKYTREREVAQIEVGAQEEAGEVVYYVRDNGVGFDMAYADKLFGVFQRLHRFEDYEGTGVGLAIVQRIVRRHGGRVWAEAAVDEGATFYFTI